jgi:DNA-directed RNA polymerase subunit RPC12/RpoP
VEEIELDPVIDCIDCGGRAHLLTTFSEEDPVRPGDLVIYRCEDCLDRWDLIVPDPEHDEADASEGLA